MSHESAGDRRPTAAEKAREEAKRIGATELLTVYELPGGGVAVSLAAKNVDAGDMFTKGVCAIASVAMSFQHAIAKMAPTVDVERIGRDLMGAAADVAAEERPQPGSYVKFESTPRSPSDDGLDPDPSEA